MKRNLIVKLVFDSEEDYNRIVEHLARECANATALGLKKYELRDNCCGGRHLRGEFV